jgi:hypothetical protein
MFPDLDLIHFMIFTGQARLTAQESKDKKPRFNEERPKAKGSGLKA